MDKNNITLKKGESPEDADEEKIDKGRKVQLIVFQLGEEDYALPIDQVKEIVLTPKISVVPQTPDYVMGIANIRGEVICVVDLERKFGLRRKSHQIDGVQSQGNFTMVIESENFNIGILVNLVPNTLAVYTSQIENSGNVLQHSSLDEASIKGVVKNREQIIILLDVLAMLKIGELKTDFKAEVN